MSERSSKRAEDENQIAARMVSQFTDDSEGDTAEVVAEAIRNGKNPVAVLLGRNGGLKGGKARAKKLSAERRREIAKKAAAARWGKKD